MGADRIGSSVAAASFHKMSVMPPISPGRPRQWTRERALRAYADAAERLGQAPSIGQLRADEACKLPIGQIYHLFGGIEQLAKAAGLDYQHASRTRYEPARMLRRLTWLADELGRVPAPADYRQHYRDGYGYLVRTWGSFDGALNAAGLDQFAELVTVEMATSALRTCASELGCVPTWREYRLWAMDVDETNGQVSYSAEHPSVHVLRSLLGSWSGALQLAGLASAQPDSAPCVAAIRECAQELGKVPTASEYRTWSASEGQPGMSELLRALGSWNEALASAQMEAHMRKWTRADVRDWMGTWARQDVTGRRPERAEWDIWANQQRPRAPRSATVARLTGEGSWRAAWRSRFAST